MFWMKSLSPGVAVLFALVVSAGCLGRTAPSAEECTHRWNRAENASNQQAVAQDGFTLAAVHGWTIKTGEGGCGVIFRLGRERRWVIFGQTITRLDSAPGDWSRAGGSRWGVDSPEGGDTSINGRVDANGTVSQR